MKLIGISKKDGTPIYEHETHAGTRFSFGCQGFPIKKTVEKNLRREK